MVTEDRKSFYGRPLILFGIKACGILLKARSIFLPKISPERAA